MISNYLSIQEILHCTGLHMYMSQVLPLTDWALVSMKPVITSFLRRLDKMMAKIHKNHRIYVAADWKAISVILSGKIIPFLLITKLRESEPQRIGPLSLLDSGPDPEMHKKFF
jgi:hypothetical protein